MNQLIISAATEGTNPLVPNVWEMGVVLVGFALVIALFMVGLTNDIGRLGD